MSAEALQQAFFREMDKLRRGPKRIEPLDMAEVARKVGLPPHEAVLQIQKYAPYGRQGSGDMFDALAIFLCSLCAQGKVNRVLEYVTVPSVLTARLAEGHKVKSVSYIAPYEHVAQVLQVLFEGTAASIAPSTAELVEDPRFDAIICAPPLGHRPQGQSHADGFGGEVVRQLVPLLATGGTFYWVTGRGAVFNPRAKETLADLRNEGLNAVATVDVAPGSFLGTTIEGVVIALRREAPAKRLVGALRDIETAVPMASALLAGPSRKAGASWAWLDSEDQRTFGALEHERLLQKLAPRGRQSEGADHGPLPSKFSRWGTDSATNHDGQLRQERSILKVLLTIRSEERVVKTYPDSVIAIADGHARLHMSVCAKVHWHPPFVAATTARVAVAVVGYDIT